MKEHTQVQTDGRDIQGKVCGMGKWWLGQPKGGNLELGPRGLWAQRTWDRSASYIPVGPMPTYRHNNCQRS